MSSKEVQTIFLAIEAVLIVISLATGERAMVGMCCYWGLVAFYHLTDFVFRRLDHDRKQ